MGVPALYGVAKFVTVDRIVFVALREPGHKWLDVWHAMQALTWQCWEDEREMKTSSVVPFSEVKPGEAGKGYCVDKEKSQVWIGSLFRFADGRLYCDWKTGITLTFDECLQMIASLGEEADFCLCHGSQMGEDVG